MSNGEKKRNNGRSAKGGTQSSKAGGDKGRFETGSYRFQQEELEKAYSGAVRKFEDNLKRLTD